jgi:SAM-dependent methyltransferase
VREFYAGGEMPVHNMLLMDTRDQARAMPRRPVTLGVCGGCGFITNTHFDPSRLDYGSRYEATQHFSGHFTSFAERLARRLADELGVRGRTVVEIGCGGGDFLALLCQIGENRGIGIDPAADPAKLHCDDGGRVRFVQEHFTAAHGSFEPDAILCRHTLEHIPDVREFLRTVRASIGERLDTLVFFELPDTARVLREAAFWDIYYEHCSYFTAGSLARLFRECDFDVTHLWRDFGDQYLMLIARPSAAPTTPRLDIEDDLPQTCRDVERFQEACPRIVARWRERIGSLHAAGRRPVLWGAGSKAVGFVETLGLTDEVAYLVDINPRKCGKYLPGTGHEIIPPEALADYRPEAVIVMNPVYRDEVCRLLAGLGLHPELIPA